jgi:hypothetical protein
MFTLASLLMGRGVGREAGGATHVFLTGSYRNALYCFAAASARAEYLAWSAVWPRMPA